MKSHDDRNREEGSARQSSTTTGGDPGERRDAYGQRSGASGGYTGREAVGTETRSRAFEPGGDREEHFDHEYERWRDEHLRGLDRDYEAWRQHRFARDFSDWRSIRAAQQGLRTGSGPPITHADRERELRGERGDADQPGRASSR
jgi:hypothetical protein